VSVWYKNVGERQPDGTQNIQKNGTNEAQVKLYNARRRSDSCVLGMYMSIAASTHASAARVSKRESKVGIDL
jgi:hypothetical protein